MWMSCGRGKKFPSVTPPTTGASAAGIAGAADGPICASPLRLYACICVWNALASAEAVPEKSIDMPVGDTLFTVRPCDRSQAVVALMSAAAGP